LDRRGVLVTVAVTIAAVAMIVGGLVVALRPDESGSDERSEDPAADRAASGATAVPGEPDEAIRAAAERLGAAGTFTYVGVTASSFPNDPDPMMTRPLVDRVEGAIAVEGRSIERVTPDYGDTIEHLVIDNEMWSRWSFRPAEVDERPWIVEEVDPEAIDARSILRWLDSSTDHHEGRADAEGRRVIAASVAPSGLPEGMTATLEVTLDEHGDPVVVAIRASDTTSDPHWLFEATYELSALGEPVDIARPSPSEIDHTPSVHSEDLTAADVDPIGLAPPPPGWELVGGFAEVVAPGCDLLNIDYNAPDGADFSSLQLDVTTPECARPPEGGRPFRAGDLSGTISGDAASSTGAVLVGDAMVVFTAANLADPESVLASLGPIDPEEQAYYVP
jgi:hypothetical protein